jgi:membrane fusion protein, multidrug efflux system
MESHAHDEPPPGDVGARRPGVSWGLRFVAVVAIVAAAGAAGLLAIRRSRAATEEGARREVEVSSGMEVRTALVAPSASSHHLILLGETRPFLSVTLYAKVSGYLKSISVDKGDIVKADQLLAVIESPETDAAWSAAQADHAQKALTAARIKQLLDKKYVSPDEADRAAADELIARERLSSLAQQREFENMRAPFNGVVTARYADQGALVQNAASSQTSALPVVTVDLTDSLRVYTYLDQADAENIRPGLRGVLTMDERPGMKMPVTVARTGGALDPKTRKLLVEFDVLNLRNAIVPGSFVHVELDVPSPMLPEIPVEALTVRQNQSQVPILAPDNTVHFRNVVVANNDGRRIRLTSGAQIGERVVLSIGDGIADGARVRPAPDDTSRAKPR